MRPVCTPALILATSLVCFSNCSNPRDASVALAQGPSVGDSAISKPLSRADLVSAGESTYWASNYDSARTLWRATLRRARAAGDDTSEARILTWLGLTSWRKGDYRDARQLGEGYHGEYPHTRWTDYFRWKVVRHQAILGAPYHVLEFNHGGHGKNGWGKMPAKYFPAV